MPTQKYKVLFIQPPVLGSLALRRMFPLNLGLLATLLRDRADCEVKVIDMNSLYKRKCFDEVFSECKLYQPDLIGITALTLSARNSYKLAQRLSPLNIPIIGGGLHMSLYPQEALTHAPFDLIVMDEADESIFEVVEHYRNGKPIKDIAGISYRDTNGQIISNNSRPPFRNLDDLPIIDRTLCDIDDYVGKGNKEDLGIFGIMTTSRGCPGRCTFCSRHGEYDRIYRYMSADRVFREVLYLRDNFGINYFYFQEDAFTVNKQRVLQLCDLIIRKKSTDSNFKINWLCSTRADCVSYDLLKAMKESGCDFITYGFESGDPLTQKKLKKVMDPEKILEVVKMTYNAGIKVRANFMVGFPWETEELIENTMLLMRRLYPYVRTFSDSGLLKPVPGAEIYREYHAACGFTDWWLKDRFLGKEDQPLYVTINRPGISLQEETLEKDFFNYSRLHKKLIRKFFKFVGTTEANVYNKFPRKQILTSLYYLSKLLYKLNPFLERRIMPPLYDKCQLLWRHLKFLH